MSSSECCKALQTHLNVLLGHFFVLHGEQQCDADLSDLSCLLFPEEEGHTHAVCLVLQMDKDKTNRGGRTQFMGAMHNKDPLLCPWEHSPSISSGAGRLMASQHQTLAP